MKRTILLILIFALTLTQVYAQQNPREGYIITNGNDTIFGRIDYLSGAENAVACHFCAEGQNVFRVYHPSEIKGYRFKNNGVYYISRHLPVADSLMFAECLLQGGISLYRYIGADDEEFFFLIDDKGSIASVKKESYGHLDPYVASRTKRENIRTAAMMLNKSDDAVRQLWKKDITADNLVDIVSRYDGQYCTENGECIRFQYSTKESNRQKFRFHMEAGAGFLRNEGNNSALLRLGLGGEVFFPRSNPHLSVLLMGRLGIYKKSEERTEIVWREQVEGGGSEIIRKTERKTKMWPDIDCGVVYRFTPFQPSSAFLRGGISLFTLCAYAGGGFEMRFSKQRLQLMGTVGYSPLAKVVYASVDFGLDI